MPKPQRPTACAGATSLLAAIPVLGSVLAGTATAHHSPAAFDLNKKVIIEGTLTKFLFANPHTYLTVESVGPNGERVSQDVEVGPISAIQPLGLTRDSLRVGKRVTVRANPSRRGAGHTVLGLDVARADGKLFPLFALSASARPASTALATSIEGVYRRSTDSPTSGRPSKHGRSRVRAATLSRKRAERRVEDISSTR